MYSLTINFGRNGALWGLMFRTEEAAQVAFDILAEPAVTDTYNPGSKMVRLVDDFSQKMVLNRDTINGFVLENMDISGGAHIERALAQSRVQQKAQRMMEADPALRAGRQGPAILTPGIPGNGQWPRQ